MPFKKYLPKKEDLLEIKSLRILGDKIFEPNLWHFNRHSVSYAALVGGICCFLPIPFQMIPCIFFCILIRCNVPLAGAIVWISNPITMPPMMYFAYRIGCLLLGQPDELNSIDMSIEWLTTQIALVWQPLLLGALVCGFTMGTTGYMAVRLYWRRKIIRQWRLRRERMKFPEHD